MNLSGKKLLILSGSNGANDIVNYAKSCGVTTIATDFLEVSPAKQLADFAHDVSTTDVDGVVDLARKYDVDGITTGTSEASMFTIIQVCKRLSLPFYATDSQLETINNKRKFKETLIAHGVPVIPQYPTQTQDGKISYEKIKFPAVLKPVDSSGAKGISVARDSDSLQAAIAHALAYSRKKEFIAEKLIEGLSEVFVNYTFVDGRFSVSSSFDIHRLPKNRGSELVALPLLYRAPSRRFDQFLSSVHGNLCDVFRSLGLKNGVMSIQSFASDDSFYIYEAGYRLGGAQMYIFTKALNDISALEMMVNFSLTGKMTDDLSMIERDDPRFRQPCCQLNIPLQPGRVSAISGVDLVDQMEEVLNVTQNHFVGDLIEEDGSIRQLGFRIHLTSIDQAQLHNTVKRIYRTLKVQGPDGENMLMGAEHLSPEWF